MSNSVQSLEKEMENQKSILKTLIKQIKMGYQNQRIENPKAWRHGVFSRGFVALFSFMAAVGSLVLLNGWISYVLGLFFFIACLCYGINTSWRLSAGQQAIDREDHLDPKDQKKWHKDHQKELQDQFKQSLVTSVKPGAPVDLMNIMSAVRSQSNQRSHKNSRKNKK